LATQGADGIAGSGKRHIHYGSGIDLDVLTSGVGNIGVGGLAILLKGGRNIDDGRAGEAEEEQADGDGLH
jgi:hypothetical protein